MVVVISFAITNKRDHVCWTKIVINSKIRKNSCNLSHSLRRQFYLRQIEFDYQFAVTVVWWWSSSLSPLSTPLAVVLGRLPCFLFKPNAQPQKEKDLLKHQTWKCFHLSTESPPCWHCSLLSAIRAMRSKSMWPRKPSSTSPSPFLAHISRHTQSLTVETRINVMQGKVDSLSRTVMIRNHSLTLSFEWMLNAHIYTTLN